MVWVEPTVLDGRTVRLEPLDYRHAADLQAAADKDTFTYFFIAPMDHGLAAFRDYIRRTLEQPNQVAFATTLRETGQAVGSTSYLDIRSVHRGLEIGSTWIGRDHQRTNVNPESKYLMLRHAFEDLGAIRVQLKCDARNIQSQRAIAKLGARQEGVLRKHMILPDSYRRDTVMYSLTEDEWPTIKVQLERRLGYKP